MMDNAKTYLLKCIVGYETNGLSSLGHLHAKHVDDISEVMTAFAYEAIKEYEKLIKQKTRTKNNAGNK